MKYFGTDGIRAIDTEFTEEFLRKVALGIAYLPGCGKVIIGRDPRVSGRFIEKTMANVFSDSGVEVLLAGMVPTPCLAYATKAFACDYGIMLSASHNPPEYNGIKLFCSDGSKVSEETEQTVERNIEQGIMLLRYCQSTVRPVDASSLYVNYLIDTLKPDLTGMNVALDTANGATSEIAPDIFRRVGATVTVYNKETDGARINCGCGATHTQFIVNKSQSYDICFSYDGDGDRVMCAQNGKLLNGDHLLYIHAKAMKERGTLRGNAMVGTVMSNMGTEKAYKNAEIRFVRTGVGDKYVSREMRSKGYNLGGEESGHLIFSDYLPTGDGILASLLTAMLDRDTKVTLADDIEEYPSVSDAVMTDKQGIAKFNACDKISEYLAQLGKEYRTVVRASGTEPKIRILVEARERAKATEVAAEIKKKIEECII